MLRQMTNRVGGRAGSQFGVLVLALGLMAGTGPLPARGQEPLDLALVGARARGMGCLYGGRRQSRVHRLESAGLPPSQSELTGDRLHWLGQSPRASLSSGGGAPAPVVASPTRRSPSSPTTWSAARRLAVQGLVATYGLSALGYRRVVDGLAAQSSSSSSIPAAASTPSTG
jgi:hypothetical protein